MDTEETQTAIHCPQCRSTNWDCWDERTIDCWDKDGWLAGVKVVGYLKCKDCGTHWEDVSVQPDDDCECDDD